MWTDSGVKLSRDPVGKVIQKSSVQTKKAEGISWPFTTSSARHNSAEIKKSPWKLVKGYLLEGVLDSAYFEALGLNYLLNFLIKWVPAWKVYHTLPPTEFLEFWRHTLWNKDSWIISSLSYSRWWT